MVMLAEHYDYVIGGDPDRDTIDLASTPPPAGSWPTPATKPTARLIAGC